MTGDPLEVKRNDSFRKSAGSIVLLAALSVAHPSGAEGASRRLADDSRVVDAIRAWEEWVEYQAGINLIPGMSIRIVHDQELLATNAFGFANPEAGVRASPDTLYSICSISKLFTSVAALQQRDAGRLRLDDPITEHLEGVVRRIPDRLEDPDDLGPVGGPSARQLRRHWAMEQPQAVLAMIARHLAELIQDMLLLRPGGPFITTMNAEQEIHSTCVTHGVTPWERVTS